MSHLLTHKLLLLTLSVLSSALIEKALGEQPREVVTIRVINDTNCLVGEAQLPCANVVAHLRDVLKVAEGTYIRVLADKTSGYDATANLMDQLQKSRLRLKIGSVNVAADPKD
jgi:biopolymer transport protein ExbD